MMGLARAASLVVVLFLVSVRVTLAATSRKASPATSQEMILAGGIALLIIVVCAIAFVRRRRGHQ
jgi:Co/Zn/Cd efflux system component